MLEQPQEPSRLAMGCVTDVRTCALVHVFNKFLRNVRRFRRRVSKQAQSGC